MKIFLKNIEHCVTVLVETSTSSYDTFGET